MKEQMHFWNIFFEMLNFILPVDVEMSPIEVMEAQLYYCYQIKNLFQYTEQL